MAPRDNFLRSNAPYQSCRIYDSPNQSAVDSFIFELDEPTYIEYIHASGAGHDGQKVLITDTWIPNVRDCTTTSKDYHNKEFN